MRELLPLLLGIFSLFYKIHHTTIFYFIYTNFQVQTYTNTVQQCLEQITETSFIYNYFSEGIKSLTNY